MKVPREVSAEWRTVIFISTNSLVLALGTFVANYLVVPGIITAVVGCATVLYLTRPVGANRAYPRWLYILSRLDRTWQSASGPEREELLVRTLSALAAGLAGRRHAHLRVAWAADLYDPESGDLLPVACRLRLTAGDVLAAARCRLDDMTVLAWRPLDALLASRRGSELAVLMPVTIALGLVLTRDSFYGLINDADNLGVIAAAPYAAIKGLRKYRQIDTPKRPEKKTESASGPRR